MSNETKQALEIIEAGPWHAIGVKKFVRGGPECAALWEKDLLPRAGEIAKPLRGVGFGLCPCSPIKSDGTFEYTAAFEATATAAVPPGMTTLEIARVHYLVIPVRSLADIHVGWQSVGPSVAALVGWEPYCGTRGCDCAHYPTFELYPADFQPSGKLFIYVPIKKTGS